MPVTQHAQRQATGKSTPKWNSALINVICYTCAFSSMTCQNVRHEKGFLRISNKYHRLMAIGIKAIQSYKLKLFVTGDLKPQVLKVL